MAAMPSVTEERASRPPTTAGTASTRATSTTAPAPASHRRRAWRPDPLRAATATTPKAAAPSSVVSPVKPRWGQRRSTWEASAPTRAPRRRTNLRCQTWAKAKPKAATAGIRIRPLAAPTAMAANARRDCRLAWLAATVTNAAKAAARSGSTTGVPVGWAPAKPPPMAAAAARTVTAALEDRCRRLPRRPCAAGAGPGRVSTARVSAGAVGSPFKTPKGIGQPPVGRRAQCGAPQRGSVAAGAAQEHSDSAVDDHQVHCDRPVLHVVEVETHSIFVGEVGSSADLPEAGESWPGHKPTVGRWTEGGYLAVQAWPGPDQQHVTFDDVDQLRELVQRVTAQPVPHPGDAGVVADLEQDAVVLVVFQQPFQLDVGVGHHRAELEHGERLGVEPDTFLAVEDRASGVQADDQSDDGHEGRSDQEEREGDGALVESLEQLAATSDTGLPDVE